MKYRIWRYLSLFIFSSFVITQGNNRTSLPSDQAPYAPRFNVPINNYNNHQIYLDSKNITKNKNESTQTTMILLSIMPRLLDYAKSFNPKLYKQYTGQWLKKNKYKIIKYSIFGCYVTIWLLLLSSHYYLNQPDSWSNWQAGIPFTELYTRPQELLQQELIFDIQKRYINKQNPTDFISPFVTFLNRINSEEKYVDRYLTMLNSINHLYSRRLFLINEKKIKEIELRKQRLTFVKQVFLSWAAEYNINQGKIKQPT